MVRMAKARVEPLQFEEWSEEQKGLLGPQIKEMQKGRGHPDAIFNVIKTVIRHTKLFKRWSVFANHVMFGSTLDPREREIAILRIGWLRNAEYEWAQHVVIGKNCGMTDEEIDWVAEGPQAKGWSELDSAIMQATDELAADAFITDETFARLAAHYSTEQIMDLVFAVGQYNMVSMALNTLGVQLDDGLEGFGKRAPKPQVA